MTEQDQDQVISYIQEWLDLGYDLEKFYALSPGDQVLSELIETNRGLHIVKSVDLFETICWAVMAQSISLTVAYHLKHRLVQGATNSIIYQGREYWKFPQPHEIISFGYNRLSQIGLTRAKANTVLAIAEATREEAIDKIELLRTNSLTKIRNVLTQFKGIGEWTADYVAMRCLGVNEAYPKADVGLHNALKNILGWDRKPTMGEIEDMFKPWQGYEAYVTFYLWNTLV